MSFNWLLYLQLNPELLSAEELLPLVSPVQCSAHMDTSSHFGAGQDVFTIGLLFAPSTDPLEVWLWEMFVEVILLLPQSFLPQSFHQSHPLCTWLTLAGLITVQKNTDALPWGQARAEGPKGLSHSSCVRVTWSVYWSVYILSFWKGIKLCLSSITYHDTTYHILLYKHNNSSWYL